MIKKKKKKKKKSSYGNVACFHHDIALKNC
jgi:hypothetical protein